MSHLATTYASVMALISLGTKEALDSINRFVLKPTFIISGYFSVTLLKFLCANKRPNGSFSVHDGGESDIRGVYCAAAVAVACGLYSDDLFEDTASWIMR